MFNFSLFSHKSDPALPQCDPDQSKRKEALEKKQQEYKFSFSEKYQLPILELPIPKEEEFSTTYNLERAAKTAPLVLNEGVVKPTLKPAPERFKGLSDFEKLYKELDNPLVTDGWMTDESFGEQRLSGVNPGLIRLAASTSDLSLKLTAQLTDTFGQSALTEMFDNKQLYVLDYREKLADIANGPGKYLPRPIAVFQCQDDDNENETTGQTHGRLMPIAIEIDTSDTDSKVFTPEDDMLWTIAKMCFNIADANVHEMQSHLGRCHFAMEAIGAVTPRQLAVNHPLHILLAPHLKFLVYNNQEGFDKLVQPGGPVDQLLAATLDDSLKLARLAAEQWSVMQTFPENLAERGVEDDQALPHYPFRDDGLLIWNAISEYVEGYLEIYYKNEEDITDDYELQAWAKQLAATDETGGRVKDMPSQIDNVAQLAKIISVFIFNNSAGHSAVNYPQYPYLGFSPSAALAGWSDYRRFFTQQNTTEQEQLNFMLQLLPPQEVALGQVGITFALSAYHYDKLGDYDEDFTEQLPKHHLYLFNQNLKMIEKQIQVRNKSRDTAYTFLLPTEIINSPSI